VADFDVQRRPIRERIESLRSDAAKAYADFLDASTERMRAAWSDGVRNTGRRTPCLRDPQSSVGGASALL
jgi:hypothetical protein